MFLIAHDDERLISFSMHVGDGLTEAEVQAIVDSIERSTALLARAGNDVVFTTVVVVDTDHGPTAGQRKRIGQASKLLARSNQVLVTRSAVVRAMMTAMRWFAPADAHNHQETFAEARAWIVQRSGHPAHVFDAMRAELLGRMRARTTPRSSA